MVLNESEVVQHLIDSGKISDNLVENTILLVKYYCQIYRTPKGRLQKTRIVDRILHYLDGVIEDYEVADWRERISKYINRFRDTPLYSIEYIPITQKELDTIRGINNKKLEKLAFVSLVYAKLFNLRNPKNNSYVNVDYKTIFDSARIAASWIDQPMMLHDLKEMGLVVRSKKFGNLNYKVLFIDSESSDIIMKISDLRELGYQYLRWRGDKSDKFVECAECGILIRKKTNSTKYCPSCRGYQPLTIKTLVCVDCGLEFVVSSKANHSCRCENCQKEYRRKYKNQKEKERYKKKNL